MEIKFFMVLIVLLSCFNFIASYPNDLTCYNKVCPAGTTNCKQHIKSTPDKRHLQIRINCLDEFDGSLKEHYFEEVSNLDPYTHYERTAQDPVGGSATASKRFDLDPYNSEDFL